MNKISCILDVQSDFITYTFSKNYFDNYLNSSSNYCLHRDIFLKQNQELKF